MRYMLDTNTLVYVLNARPQHLAVLERFNREDPRDLFVSLTLITANVREFSRVRGLRSESWLPG